MSNPHWNFATPGRGRLTTRDWLVTKRGLPLAPLLKGAEKALSSVNKWGLETECVFLRLLFQCLL
jgi:hypothetical protein